VWEIGNKDYDVKAATAYDINSGVNTYTVADAICDRILHGTHRIESRDHPCGIQATE